MEDYAERTDLSDIEFFRHSIIPTFHPSGKFSETTDYRHGEIYPTMEGLITDGMIQSTFFSLRTSG